MAVTRLGVLPVSIIALVSVLASACNKAPAPAAAEKSGPEPLSAPGLPRVFRDVRGHSVVEMRFRRRQDSAVPDAEGILAPDAP